jgi:hypothetical protein
VPERLRNRALAGGNLARGFESRVILLSFKKKEKKKETTFA